MSRLNDHAHAARCQRSPGISMLRWGTWWAAFLALPAGAQTFVAYDSFPNANLNGLRWYGDEGRTYGGLREEANRSIVAGQVRIQLRTLGDTTSSTGFSSSRNSLVAVKSPTITAMRGTLTMRSGSLTACAANATQPSIARARMFGFFFNAGDAIAGSNFNDVFAGVQLSRASNTTDAPNVYRVNGFAGVCADDNCIATTSLGSVDLGTVALNTATQLQMAWDPANKRFSYVRDAGLPAYLPYTLADAQEASFPTKRLEINNIVPRCVGGTRPSAVASADFDNIEVNSGALAPLGQRQGWFNGGLGGALQADAVGGPMN